MTPERRTKLLIIAGAATALAVIIYMAVPAIVVKLLPLPPVPPPLEGELLRVEKMVQPEPSRLALQLRAPMSVLEEVANQELEQEFTGREDQDLMPVLSKGWIEYRVLPGDLKLSSSTAGIKFRVSLKDGSFRAGGRSRPGKVPISAEMRELRGEVGGTVLPSLAEDWEILPGIKEPALDLDRATLRLGPVGAVDVRKVLESGLNWKQEQIIHKVVKRIQDKLSARDGIKRLWDEELTGLHAVDEERDAWIQVRPKKVLARPLDFSRADEVTFHAAIDFAASAHVPKPSDPTPVPFPNLTIDPGLQTESEIRIPIAVSLEAANQLLGAETLRFDLNGSSTFEATGISVKGLEGARMQVRVPFEVSRGLFSRKPIEDVLLLEGTPVIDLEGQRAGVSGLSYSEERGASWEQRGVRLLKPILLKQLKGRLVWDFRPELEKLRQRGNEELRQRLEERDELEGMADIGEFGIRDVYLVRQEVGSAVFVVVMSARGDVQLRLHSLAR